MPTLFDPITLGEYELKNRIFMAPLTRGRTGSEGVPDRMVAEYYAQRADAGLLIAEATAINAQGRGWRNAPGIYTEEQVAGWRGVADAVHARGGRIFMQIWHMGRTVLPEYANGQRPVAPSEVKADGEIRGKDGKKRPFVMPRAITIPEIKETIADFARAAERAVEAGFDGIEIHGANNFLVDSFLRDGTNRREDEYGGPIENRARFLNEVVEAVTGMIGAGKVGVRLSPTNSYFGITDSEPHITFPGAAATLNGFDLAYLHVLESKPANGMAPVSPLIRAAYTGTLIKNGGYDHQSGNKALNAGEADAIAFGVPFIANPDLVERYRYGLPLTDSDPETYYTPGRQGYADYATHMMTPKLLSAGISLRDETRATGDAREYKAA